MTYNVFGGTLNLARSINQSPAVTVQKRRHWPCYRIIPTTQRRNTHSVTDRRCHALPRCRQQHKRYCTVYLLPTSLDTDRYYAPAIHIKLLTERLDNYQLHAHRALYRTELSDVYYPYYYYYYYYYHFMPLCPYPGEPVTEG